MSISFHHGKLYVTRVYPDRPDDDSPQNRIVQVREGMQVTKAEWPTCASCGDVMDDLNEVWVSSALRENADAKTTTCRNCGASNRLSGSRRERTRVTIEK